MEIFSRNPVEKILLITTLITATKRHTFFIILGDAENSIDENQVWCRGPDQRHQRLWRGYAMSITMGGRRTERIYAWCRNGPSTIRFLPKISIRITVKVQHLPVIAIFAHIFTFKYMHLFSCFLKCIFTTTTNECKQCFSNKSSYWPSYFLSKIAFKTEQDFFKLIMISHNVFFLIAVYFFLYKVRGYSNI